MKAVSVFSSILLTCLLAACGGGAGTGTGGSGGTGTGTGGGGDQPPQDIPTLTAIAPSSAAVGTSAVNLALYGSSFASGAIVQWNKTTISFFVGKRD